MATPNILADPGAILGRESVTESRAVTLSFRQELDVLRWGGLSGLLAGIVFVASIVYQVAFIGTATTASGAGPIIRFPSVQSAIVVGQSLFLVGTILAMPLFLALYRALRTSSLAAASFGTGLSFLGLAVLAVESEPNVAMAAISAQYHAAGATAAQQANAVQLWQATQGMFNQFDTCAYIFLSVGFVLLGVAMRENPGIGLRFGALTAAFGVAGLFGVALFAVDSAMFSIFALLTFVIFPLVIGWKVFRLSYSKVGPPAGSVVPAQPT